MAGAGAGCLPPRAPLCLRGLRLPLLLVCCEDPGRAQTHQPPGRFLEAQALGPVEGAICVWSPERDGGRPGQWCACPVIRPTCAGHVLCCQPGSQGLLFSSS